MFNNEIQNISMKFTGEFFVPDEKYKKSSEDRELAIEHLQRYNTILPLVSGKDVLDIASGEGYGSNILASKAASVTGVDINEELVAHATATYGKTNLNFKAGNVVSIPLENASVDIVVSFETLEHVNEQEQQKFLQEITRVLKKDGVLIISTPNKTNYSDRFHHSNEFHVNELEEAEFVSLLKQNFQQVQLFNQGQEIVSLVYNKEKYLDRSLIPSLPIVKEHFRLQGKYLLAVCGKSDKMQLPDISSVVVEGNKSFFDLTERIVQLQDEVEELGAWGRKSAAEIDQLREMIVGHNKVRETNEKIIAEKSAVINQFDAIMSLREKLHQDSETIIRVKNDIITQLEKLLVLRDKQFQDTAEELKQYKEETSVSRAQMKEVLNSMNELKLNTERELSAMTEKLSNAGRELEDQKNAAARINIQKLLLEEKLEHIYSSEGWKMLSVYYGVKGRLLPEHSRRYKTLKKWFQSFKKNKKYPPQSSEALPPVKKEATRNEIIATPVEIHSPIVFPVFDKIKVSIVIPAYNNWEFTKNCLLSIHKYNDGVPFEIIVGDNVSTDDTQRLPEFFKNVNYIRNPENLGYIKNVNNAASKAKGEYILTLNNDTTVTEGWLINLLRVMDADPKAGLVGSKLVYFNGSLQEAGGIIWRDASGWNYGNGSNPELPEFNYVKEVDYISGASNLIRKELWEKLKGLDLRYVPAYFDDSDLAFGIRSLGYKVIYQPLSVVIHYEGLTHGTNTSEGTKTYQKLNLEKFREKWKEELKQQYENGENVFWARDKSGNKKTILVIDHYVPHFDRDAGSRTVFQYLKLFVSLGFNVKFIGDNFYKHEPYTTILQQMGIEVLYGNWYANNWQDWIKSNSSRFDYVLLNRPHISIKYIDFIRTNTKARILYYGHDLHFLRELKQYEIEKNKDLLKSSEKWKETETYIFRMADIILAPSDEEMESIKELKVNNNVHAIRPYIFETVPKAVNNFSERKSILFVGGFNHKPNVDAVLWFANHIWPDIKRAIPEVKFNVVGSSTPKEILDLAGNGIEIKGFVEDNELERLYGTARIVVIPLRYGAGVKGKTVEAMFNGLPIVSTQFGIEGMPGNISFIKAANEAKEFGDEVIRLYNLPDSELASLSSKETQYIYDNFYFDTVKASLLSILNNY
jgi:GT2 family glycosyltransferase/2-polyprenyl-3-methyl-5-hydroxy-6-metoxy-1,4-benzoquinol methylase